MPKYYCDYCDKYLTHDSASVRKAHAGGRQHNQLIREHYQRVADRLAARAARKKPKTQRAEVRPGMPMPFLPKDYPALPVPGMPLAVPFGVPPRPGFPPQTIIPPGTLPIVAPGVTPPAPPVDLAAAPLNGAIVTPFGTLLPPAALAGRFDATAPPPLAGAGSMPIHAPMHRGRGHFEDRGDRGHYGGGGGYRR